MNLKDKTDPEIIELIQSLTRTKPVTNSDLNETRKLVESRSLTRKQKQDASRLINKYQYVSQPSRFQ